MGKRKPEVLFIIFFILTCQLLFTSVSEKNVMSYELLYNLQKDPTTLEQALNSTLSTMMYAEENFPSQESAEKLLKRIYTKIELSEEFGEDDEIFTAIISESTDDLLNALKALDKQTDQYSETYVLFDFVFKDFSNLIEQFHFEKFKAFFQLNKLDNLKLIETVDGKQLQELTTHIIETIVENDYYLNNESYHAIVKLGKEKLLNYLSIQINPYLNKKQVDTYDQQHSLLKAYTKLYETYYGQSFIEKIPKEPYKYYLELAEYYEYLSNVEILSRRFLTAEEETLIKIFPVFLDYIEEFQTLNLKTDKLSKALLKMIKNASTRLSYDKKEMIPENYKFSEIMVSDEEINESLKNLFAVLKPKKKDDQPVEENMIKKILSTPSFFMAVFAIIGVFVVSVLLLPLKLKGTLFKNLGFNSKALSLFEKAAIKHPMDPDIHIKTAQIYEKLGREEDAMNEYKIASKVLDMKED